MRVEQRMQVSDITHSVLARVNNRAFNISGGCSTAGGTSSQRPACLPTIDVRNLAFISVTAVL